MTYILKMFDVIWTVHFSAARGLKMGMRKVRLLPVPTLSMKNTDSSLMSSVSAQSERKNVQT